MMLFHRQALYNLIQINLNRVEPEELYKIDLQPWQIENYREKPNSYLFHQLDLLGIHFHPEEFEKYATEYEAPEEILATLASARPPLEQDHIFLLLFELWRRTFPEKRTLSIFCDELDHQILAYDLKKPNQIPDTLAYLQQLLAEHVESGMDPQQAFQSIQIFCANDVESFLFDFILDEIDAGNKHYASELLDSFTRYMKGSLWFAYLAARTSILEDPEEGYERLEKVVAQVGNKTELNLVEEMLYFVANSGNHSLFHALALKTIPLLKMEKDFREFLEASYAHYDYLELPQPALAIAQIFHSRSSISADQALTPQDPSLKELQTILNQKLHFSEEKTDKGLKSR